MLKASVDAGVKRFVYSSSSSVYGDVEQFPTPEDTSLNPMSPYALQKLVGEQYCHLFSELYDIETVSLRYFNVYGERMNFEGAYKTVVAVFTEQSLNGEKLNIVNDGEQRRDFTYVGDVVNANIMASISNPDDDAFGQVYNVGTGSNYSVNEIAAMVSEDTVYLPPRIGESRVTLADIQKIEKTFGWRPQVKVEDWIAEQLNGN